MEEESTTKAKQKKKGMVWWVMCLVLMMVQTAVSALLAMSLLKTSILSQWIVATAIAVLVGLWLVTVVPLFFKKRLLPVRIINIVLSVACVVGGVFALRYTNAVNSFLDKVSYEEVEVVEEEVKEEREKGITEKTFVMYVSGSDSRVSVDDPEARSDVNIIMVVDPVKRKILLVSIPRDTYVQLHGTEGLKDKLTHAGLGMYGPDMSRLTLEDFLDIKIDYTVKVSFDTVISVVDELDGIEIYSDKEMWLPVEGSNRKCHFVVGTQWVDGECALRFARERKSYATGDKHRGENQQEVLSAIINKIAGSRDYLLRLPEILNIAADSFTTTFRRDDITAFIRMQLENPAGWQIETANLDGVGDLLPTYTYPDRNLWVMLWEEEALQELKDKINEYLADGRDA